MPQKIHIFSFAEEKYLKDTISSSCLTQLNSDPAEEFKILLLYSMVECTFHLLYIINEGFHVFSYSSLQLYLAHDYCAEKTAVARF